LPFNTLTLFWLGTAVELMYWVGFVTLTVFAVITGAVIAPVLLNRPVEIVVDIFGGGYTFNKYFNFTFLIFLN
jgi:hypothetical protein